MFIVSPLAGKNLMGNAMIGEYFRVFVTYGVIGMALALHAWQSWRGRKSFGRTPKGPENFRAERRNPQKTYPLCAPERKTPAFFSVFLWGIMEKMRKYF